MRVRVYLLRRAGRRRAWREVANEPGHLGELITHFVSRGAHPYRAASLRTIEAPALAPAIPDLYEPVLLGIYPAAFRLRGYERSDDLDGARAVLQEWHCELP